jgi:AcrR family transcriptional regulator
MPRLIDHNERRERLAEATWRVILRDGVGGASVRRVAAEAGQSAGSLRHLFSTQSELLVYALQLVVDRASARIAALPQQESSVSTVEEVALELLPLDRERRAEMEIYVALFAAANANDGLRAPREAAHKAVRGLCRWLIEQLDDGGVLAPEADRELEVMRLHALIDGLAAHVIYEPADADPGWARDALIRHIRSLHCRARPMI